MARSTRRTARLLVAGLAFGAVAVAVAPAAVAAPATLVIVAAGPSYADVSFRQPVGLDARSARIDTAGRYGGWYLQRHGETFGAEANVVGSVLARDLDLGGAPASKPVFTLGSKDTLEAGTYRLFAFGDRPVRVEVPITSGSGSLTVRTTGRTRSSYAARELPVSPGVTDAEVREPFEATAHTLALSVLVARSDTGVTFHQAETCVVPRASTACPADNDRFGSLVGGYDGYGIATMRVYAPGSLASGSYQAIQKLQSAGALHRAAGAVMTLEVR